MLFRNYLKNPILYSGVDSVKFDFINLMTSAIFGVNGGRFYMEVEDYIIACKPVTLDTILPANISYDKDHFFGKSIVDRSIAPFVCLFLELDRFFVNSSIFDQVLAPRINEFELYLSRRCKTVCVPLAGTEKKNEGEKES
jgi:hypothetical protein